MIFLDTGAFLARYLQQDQYHEKALASWEKLRRGSPRCFTSNFVLDETFTLLGRRMGHARAAERAKNVLSSRVMIVLRPEESDELEAVELFEKYADQAVSFTDCVSFVLMRRHRLAQAFSYDRHFRMAGFQLWG